MGRAQRTQNVIYRSLARDIAKELSDGAEVVKISDVFVVLENIGLVQLAHEDLKSFSDLCDFVEVEIRG